MICMDYNLCGIQCVVDFKFWDDMMDFHKLGIDIRYRTKDIRWLKLENLGDLDNIAQVCYLLHRHLYATQFRLL